MVRKGIVRALTGLAAGALLTAGLLGVFFLAWDVGAPFVPYPVFEWFIRVLPGGMVTFGLDLTLRTLRGLGLDVAQTAKAAEQVLAVASLFLVGLLIGLLFFLLVRTARRWLIRLCGVALGVAVGASSVAASLAIGTPAHPAGKAVFGVLVIAVFVAWGWGLAHLLRTAFPRRMAAVAVGAADTGPETARVASDGAARRAEAAAEAEARDISRRRFLIQMGGLAAVIIVVGADVGRVLSAQTTPPTTEPTGGVVQFPNAGSPISAVPGTRAEYTPVADFYRVDIDLSTPDIAVSGWDLTVDGLVAKTLSLTLDQLKSRYKPVEQFATLSCISNDIGGPLIGTTLWTGVSLRDVLADAGPAAGARYVRFSSADDFGEEIALDLVNSDPRIILAHSWDRQPLTPQHGFPLRIFVPDRYGMKQPKWISRITLAADSKPGYWVQRDWDAVAEVKTTSVIDIVAVKAPLTRDGRTFIPIGGIAFSGAKGISKVEIQIDDGPWDPAELRQPLSGLTWVVWRYDWPFDPGKHQLTVRAFDGQGRPQETTQQSSQQGVAATGLFSEHTTIEPSQP